MLRTELAEEKEADDPNSTRSTFSISITFCLDGRMSCVVMKP